MPKINIQAQAAKQFAETWKGRGYEKGESQTFWNMLLRDVLLVEKPEEWIHYEEQVKMDSTNFIDARIDRTKVMIEQKSIDKDLSKAIKQSDGTFLTPYQQARRYRGDLPKSLQPDWIVTCNFQEFRVYDMEHPNEEPQIILLENLDKEYYRLEFLVKDNAHLEKQKEVSLQAGLLVGKLYDAILPQYGNESEQTLHSLNILCVRLVFCFYAEDAGIFEKDQFCNFLSGYDAKDLREQLLRLFEVLNTKPEDRDPYMRDELKAFPYTNGGLFADKILVPQFTDEIKYLMLHDASIGFDWSGISPTIFGAVFESTLNLETRRKGGMHYTSIENIHKVIDPLFMDDLHAEFEEIMRTTKPNSDGRRKKLNEFQDKLASLTFFDPACGSGNFLTETFLSLRRLENDVLKAMSAGVRYMFNPVKVSIKQFHGIEINDFAVTVALTALWISEYQMLQETQPLVDVELDFLPLTSNSNIVKGNSLDIAWSSVAPSNLNYIIGNPPFVGYSLQSPEQKNDMLRIMVDDKGNPYKTAGKMDYVCCWYKKAAEFMKGKETRTALVSTNSVCQGEQVASLWEPLFNDGIIINFAHRTFKWGQDDNKTSDMAHVHCIIVGFSYQSSKNCIIFINGQREYVKHINAYLLEGDDMFVSSKNKPISNVLQMLSGNRPTDGGYLILSEDEKRNLESKEPKAIPFIKRFMMGYEFINNVKRYCLWLDGVSPKVIKEMPLVYERVRLCREERLKSSDKGRVRLADTPHLFREKLNPNNFIAVPKVSSERRRYIPMGYLDGNTIAGDKLFIIPEADIYMFGILISSVHMAWMRIVAGRLKSDYSYSINIVYNNFVWPNPTEEQKQKIMKTAQAILDARAKYPDCSLADLYDDVLMPAELRKAHQENDMAVMEAYGFDWHNMSESQCVTELFKLYDKNA